jgi:hypothetical protein
MPPRDVERRMSAMLLADAVDHIRDALGRQCACGKERLWSRVVMQIRKNQWFDARYADIMLEVIRSFVNTLPDNEAVSLWRDTEPGMQNQDDDEELFIDSVRMDLEMELLELLTEAAYEEANARGQ